MIWHLYGNNSNDDKVIMTDSSDQMIHQYKSFTNMDDDSKKTTYTSPHSQSLFLNFTSNPSKHKETRARLKTASAKKTSTTSSVASSTSPASPSATIKASVKVNGVNILNRKNLDSKTIVDRIQKRRENHNDLERRRRNCINHTISELSRVIPSQRASGQQQKLNKHSVLKSALDHILYLQTENALIKQQLLDAYNGVPAERYSQHGYYHYPYHYYNNTSSSTSSSSI
ncbi:unnamed protein product [Mucor circinelloides]|uniref:BHLH domain-containing protein n=1 Tax=Mucor circinelloides f. circinelloides (strain 1006PhL) TaxID=1220926 RepID=S2KCW2_MUCC1|nr:hypothetical protein HMPREF1544_03004 [Mucor circinelloides 1006PhL]